MIMTKLWIVFLFIINFAVAQQKWQIQNCIQYALQHNIDLTVQSNRLKMQEINLHESKMALLPDLNTGIYLNNNFGRNIDANTNTVTYNQTMSNTYWVSSSIDLFQGLVKLNNLRMQKYLLQAQKQEMEIRKNKLIMDIITAYYTLQYSMELEKVAESQVNLAENQYKRMQKLVEVGRETPLNAQDLKRQWKADRLKLTQATQAKERQLLQLKYLLRMPDTLAFTIDSLSSPVLANENTLPEVEITRLQELPSIKKQDLMLDVARKEYAIAKGKVYPRLTLSAGYNTYYFGGNPNDFNTQLQNNQNQQVFLGLNIPLFNGASVHSEIRRKKLEMQNQALRVQQQKEQMQMAIKETFQQAKAASDAYLSAESLLEYSRMSFESIRKKLEKGRATTTEFELVKQQLRMAEAEKIKALLTYKIYRNMLVFYQTGNWNHLKE